MNHLVFAMALACALAGDDAWEPPENPDPQAILNEIAGDTRARRYEIALAKLVWFHEHALTIQPALVGVRLSFALMYWHQLAEKYPPALEQLEAVRDRAAQLVKDGKKVRESFQDMASINRELGEHALTKEVFEELDRNNPKDAKQVFNLAQPALIKAKAYELCARYINPKRDFSLMQQMHTQGKRLADDPRFGNRHLDFTNKKFSNDATTLVAILALNDRNAEAQEIAKLAEETWNDEAFHDQLNEALEGFVPEPWP